MRTTTIFVAAALGLLAAGPAFANCKDHRGGYGARKSVENSLPRAPRTMTYRQDPSAKPAGTASRRPFVDQADPAFGMSNDPATSDRSSRSAVANSAIEPPAAPAAAAHKKVPADMETARAVQASPEPEAAAEAVEGAEMSPPSDQED